MKSCSLAEADGAVTFRGSSMGALQSHVLRMQLLQLSILLHKHRPGFSI